MGLRVHSKSYVRDNHVINLGRVAMASREKIDDDSYRIEFIIPGTQICGGKFGFFYGAGEIEEEWRKIIHGMSEEEIR